MSLQISQWLFRLKKILSTIDAPPGVPGVLKNHIFLQMKQFSVCAKIALKKHKLQKPSKLKKTCQKIPVFLDIFEYSSTWGQSLRTKLQLACLVDPSASFDTPGTHGGASIVEIQEF